MISVEDVSKSFGERTILDGVSVRFGKGEVVSLLGPSGAGKSTLLRCLNGLETPDRGVIRVGDQCIVGGAAGTGRAALDAIRRRVGFVFQQWHLFAHRTVLGNVIEAPVQVRREPIPRATARGREILARVGLSHRESAYPDQLSGGEQQRTAIARALAMEPDVLLLDEPTSALDPQRVNDLVEILEGLVKDGLSLIAVTHETGFARRLSSRIVVLAEGRIVEDGPAAEVLDSPRDPRTRQILGQE